MVLLLAMDIWNAINKQIFTFYIKVRRNLNIEPRHQRVKEVWELLS
jgi:hypothetical protein